MASAVNRWVPADDSSHPVIEEYLRRGRDLFINNTDFSPVCSCTLLCMALPIRTSVKHSHSIL
ncbi:unnamed protein product [Staurois parvus]|uniref:Uncharacterized protein n=1 Tax=Staurois parvus TaxID=386267 RepID=A0ABN9APR1_9NEOB|nr:unnamed protein product [Staurois parvus]